VMRRGWFPNVTKELERQRETERMYAELQEAQAAREALTRMLVHDMRTPLTNLLTGLRTAKAMDDPEMERELVEVAMRGGERLLGMVNELLDLDRMGHGQMPVSHQTFPVSEVVGEALCEVTRLAEERDLQLDEKLEEAPEPLQVIADPDLTRRVLVNLLGNAIRFTPKGGTVTVSARRMGTDGKLVELSVQDRGPGIPPEHQQRVFEAFYQVDPEGTRLGNTGLGLAFCKLAVAAQGGAIGVESTPGHGSRFWFRLPAEENSNVPVTAGAHSSRG
jgi:two-component system, sensor histidine kinase and response regulator